MIRYKYIKKINFQKIKRKIIFNSLEMIFISELKQIADTESILEILINAYILK